MLPTARFQAAGVLGAVLDVVQPTRTSADPGATDEGLRLAVSLLLVVTSFAFVVPAHTSFCLGRLWHAAVFMLMTTVCFFYHICDTDLPLSLGAEAGCPGSMRHALTLADHGWAYFCFLQMAFLVLGPEDPVMQWIDHPMVRDRPACALAMPPPWDVVAVMRLLPAAAMGAFLCLYTSWEDFHWQCILLSDVLLLCGCLSFWLHQDRRANISKVLIRLRFWRRIWNHCVLPMLLASFVFIAMETADSGAMHAVWHLVVAALAVSIIRTVHSHGLDTPSAEAEELVDASSRNPIVVQALLGSVALLGVPTILASLVLDMLAVHSWRWPMVSMPTSQRPGGYVMAIGALPALVALAAAFWLIRSTTGPQHSEPEEIVVSKQLGCSVGYAAVVFGFLAVAANGAMFPTTHVLCLIVSLCLLIVAMLLTTLSIRHPLAPESRWRCLLTLVTILVITSFVTLLLLAQQYIPNSYSIPHPMLAASEYAALVLSTLWPLTWGPEVQARWQTRKAWTMLWSSRASSLEARPFGWHPSIGWR